MKSRGRARILILAALVTGAHAEETAPRLADDGTISYRLVVGTEDSAQPVAAQILHHLAAGRIEDAALFSNAPRRRYEVLRDYLNSVGEEEFKRVYSQYLLPENRVIAEVALGPRRMIIWDLGGAGHQLAAQYYVEVEGKFLIDDVPNEERARLHRMLEIYRARR